MRVLGAKPPEVEEVLLLLLYHAVCVKGPVQVVSDVHVQELKSFDLLYCGPVDVDRGALSLLSPEVHNQLFRFVVVEGEVIFLAPLPVGLPLLCRLKT